jgi:RHS repeat-associated protein
VGRILTANTENNNTQTAAFGTLTLNPDLNQPQVRSIDGNGNIATLYFDRYGQVTKSIDSIGTKQNTYNSRGSLTQTTEWLGADKHTTSYAYNDKNQVTEIAYGEKLSSVPLAQYSNTSDRVATAANVNFIGYLKDIVPEPNGNGNTSIVNQYVVTSDKTGQIITSKINQDGLISKSTGDTNYFSLRSILKVNTVDKLTVKKLLVGDFNGDGRQDLAIGYDQEVLNTRTNDFFYITNSLSYTNSAKIAILSGDGNGHFALNSKTTVNPNGIFDNYQFEIADLAAGDFNDDGKLDLVAANFIEPFAANWTGPNNYHLFMLVNDGTGKLSSAAGNSGGNRNLKPFTSVDIKGILSTAKDLSGKDRLIVASPNSQFTSVSAYESDNNGALNKVFGYDIQGVAQDIKVADLDGDGAGEIIVNASKLYVINVETGDVQTSAYTTQNTGFWSYMAVADVNQDGKQDILVANDNATLKVFLGDRVTGKFDIAPQIYQSTSSPRGLIVAKLNNDAFPDVIIGDAFAGLDIKLHVPANSNASVVHKTFEYDSKFGQLTKSVDEEGRVTLYDINPNNGDIQSITKKGNLTAPDSVTNFSYTGNPWGLVSTITDGDGKVTENTYDPTYGYLTEVKQGGMTVSKLAYKSDNSGNIETKTDGNLKTTQYSYKTNTNRIETETYDPSLGIDKKTQYDYDDKGQLISVINSDGYGQKFEDYDGLGRAHTIKQLTATGELVQRYEYFNTGDIKSVTNSDNQQIKYFYDSRNRLEYVENIDGSITRYEYDALNNLTKVIDAEGYEATYVYASTTNDSRMRQTETRQQIKHNSYQDALVTKTNYNNALQITEVTDGKDKKTKYEYDDLGRQIHVEQELDTPLADNATKIDNYTTYYDNGNIKTIKDGNGHTTTYTYDARNLKATSTDALGNITTYSYDGAGNVTGMSTVNPNIQGTASITYGYDALNRRTTVIDALNGTSTISYDLSGNIKQIEDANHHKTKYDYNPSERTVTTTDALGNQAVVLHNTLGRISTVTQRGDLNTLTDDRITTYTDDLVNNTTTIHRPEGVVEVTKLDNRGNIKSVTTTVKGVNQTTAYTYNGLNQVTKITDALGNTQAFEYDNLGNLLTTTATDTTTGEYHTTQYQSNNLGWKTQTTDAQGRVFKNSYDAVGNVKTQTENGLRATTYIYDVLNRQTRSTTVYGADTLNFFTNYDAVGNVISAKDAEGNVTQYRYDALNRRILTIDAKHQYTQTNYDPVGNILSIVTAPNIPDNPTGVPRQVRFVYDELNRVRDVIDAEGIVTRTEYNQFGDKIAITQNYTAIVNDPNSRTTRFEYDRLGRKVKTIDAANHTTQIEYDEANNVRSVTDGNNNTTRYEYDKLNRQTQIIDANNITTQVTTYDGFGNIKSIRDSGDNLTTYEYDSLDRQIEMIDPRGKSVITEYDGLSRVESILDRNNRTRTFAYDINDNLLTESWGGNVKFTYAYDRIGNLKSSDDAGSNTTNVYNYDAIYQLTDAITGSTKFHYDYDVYGDLIQREDWVNSLKVATLDYTYDKNHQLKRLSQSGVGVISQSIEFDYDRLNQLTRISRDTANSTGKLITDYQYNAVGLLADINNYFDSTANIISHYHYEYDAGNRLILTTGKNGNSAVDYGKDNQLRGVDNTSRPDEAFDFNALGLRDGWSTVTGDSRRLLNDGKYEYLYDDEGNLSRKTEIATGSITNYEWDYRNRLTKVTSGSQVVEYLYDAEDKRVAKKINGVTTEKYIYDGADIALVVDAAGVLVERYLFGAGVDNVLSREKGGAVVWSLGDRQGSVVDLVNEDGTILNHFVYDGFGNSTGTTAADFRFGYTGRELDTETGLYYYRARYYDPKVGRFISEDPIGFSAGDTNLYRYVNNSPTNFTDPTGTTISGWADDALNAVDSSLAGFYNAVTFGLTTEIRKRLWGDVATRNHEGGFYDAGNLVGAVASFALGYGSGAQSARLSAAFVTGLRGYDVFGTTIGVVQSYNNFQNGTASGWDLLNFLPVAGFAVQNGRKIGGAIKNTFDDARSILNPHRLEMAAEGIGGGGLSHVNNTHPTGLSPSHMAMEDGDALSSGVNSGEYLTGQINRGKTLLVGEGNLSFTTSLLNKKINRENIIATTYEPYNILKNDTLANKLMLEQQNITVMHGVDARNLSNHFSGEKFENIMFNLPHTGARPSQPSNRELLRKFFESSQEHLSDSGRVMVTLKNSPHYKGWRINEQAESAGFRLVKEVPFDFNHFPEFQHTQTKIHGKSADFQAGATTYIFERAL